MLRRIVFATVALYTFAGAAAFACDGQVGKVIYEDNFADDSGGWDFTPNVATVKPPNFVFNLGSQYTSINAAVLTFRAPADADYCAEVNLPKSIAPDNKYNVSISFWGTDYSNFWMVMLSSDGTLGLFSKVNNVWQTIFSVPSAPAFKPDADAVNVVRVTTLGGKISMYLNGQLEKAIRAQVPDGTFRFGMYAQIDKPADGTTPILVKSYKVTSGQ